MVLIFNKTKTEALENIGFEDDYHKIDIHELEEERTCQTSDEIVGKYGETKWKIIDILNQQYAPRLEEPFDWYNWLHNNDSDEVSYFLSEAGSNCLNYAKFKAPACFHLWCGKKGFLLGIEQKGKGFPAAKVHRERINENKNPNRPKGRSIFNVSDTPSDDGELMQNNPTTASSGISETNEGAAFNFSKRRRPPPAIGCWDAKMDILPICTIGTKIPIWARPFGARVGAFGVPEFSPVPGGVRSFTPPVLSSHFVCELLDSNDRVENSVHFRRCKNTVFFDNPAKVTIVFMESILNVQN